jgi:hypothetical protein
LILPPAKEMLISKTGGPFNMTKEDETEIVSSIIEMQFIDL